MSVGLLLALEDALAQLCANFKQKEQILKVTRRIKPVGLYVNEDLAKETLDKREEQRPKLEEAKRNGKIAYFVLDKLIVKDRRG